MFANLTLLRRNYNEEKMYVLILHNVGGPDNASILRF